MMMTWKKMHLWLTMGTFPLLVSGLTAQAAGNTYPIVDTGQARCFSNTSPIACPAEGELFDGQDAQYHGNQPAYVDNGDGTVTDLVTGLMWQKTPSTKKVAFQKAKSAAGDFRLAGYDDWRLPTIKELYSLIDFRGESERSSSTSIPYINTDYFDFRYGDTSHGERLIDAQYWSSTEYTATTIHDAPTTFGVNFADGRIKGYPNSPVRMLARDGHFVRYVRGNTDYGRNDFFDNGDGTITDQASGLMWMKSDSGQTMNWQEALRYAETARIGGYSDWRLPNAKELQSIVDYSRSPAAGDSTKRGAAIDPIFELTEPESWYWTSTTHLERGRAAAAVYVCFGRAWGYWGRGDRKDRIDVHGAGSQRSDPKSGNPAYFARGRGPQGDEVRIYNYVRLVRGGNVTKSNIMESQNSGSYPGTIERSQEYGMAGVPDERRPMQMNSSVQGNGRRPQHQMQDFSERGAFGEPRHGGFVQRLDRDNDGKISRQEFDGPPDHFSMFDRDGDGFISEDEAPKGPPPPRRQ